MDIAIISGDDWEAAYYNGTLLVQDHKISAVHLMRNLHGYNLAEGSTIHFEHLQCDAEWLEERGSFPENVTDVKLV